MSQPSHSFTAVVLAGSRSSHDPVAEAAGVRCKALTPIGDKPMVTRVLNILQEAKSISSRVLCGPSWSIIEQEPELHSLIESQPIEWVAPQATPSTSTAFAVQSIPTEQPILITTADHALLTSEMVDFFCTNAQATDSDVIVGLVPYDLVKTAFPHSKRTVMKFKNQGYCGCNLFAFLTQKGRTIAEFWRQVEEQRKNPLHLIRTLGWMAVLRYLTGNLSLDQALEGISGKLGLKIKAVSLPYPHAAVDVDTVADLELVRQTLGEN